MHQHPDNGLPNIRMFYFRGKIAIKFQDFLKHLRRLLTTTSHEHEEECGIKELEAHGENILMEHSRYQEHQAHGYTTMS